MPTRAFFVLALLFSATIQTAAQDAPANTAAAVQISIDAAKAGSPINPFIYGQFIEHLGRCIYGGIWAEMLEDRKFFFLITDDYNPYRSLTDTPFPVVGASPWEVLGPKGSVTMVKENPFVGEHSPRIAAGSGIRQNDLAFVAGKTYVGYAWLRAVDGRSQIKIKHGGDKAEGVSVTQLSPGAEYTQILLEFKAITGTNKGWLSIEVENAPCMIGTVSLMPADNVRGMRADTLALLKQLNATMYRWPGGNFVSGYDWRDGIGPRDRRPPRKNPAWTGVEHNDVGIDEFIDFCREVGAEPMIAANTGFGDDYSAAQEVEYTNGSADTIGGGWRVKNGHAEPYRVKYWCVGNEMWGDWQLGYMQLGQYAQKHNRVATAMRRVDPDLVLVGSGDLGTKATLGDGPARRDVNWSQGMLEECANHMDLISEHFYKGDTPWGEKRSDDVAAAAILLRDEIRKKAKAHRELQKQLGLLPDRAVPIAMDEWNYWHNKYVYGELGCQYDLTDALGVAVGLHEYFRNSDIIHMAHYAQTVNVIGCIKTTKTAAFFDTTALPLLLYRREFGQKPLGVNGNHGEFSLDIAAAKTDDGTALTISIVNPTSTKHEIAVNASDLKLASGTKAWRIAGSDPKAMNTVDAQPVAIVEDPEISFDGKLKVPAFSISLFRIAIE